MRAEGRSEPTSDNNHGISTIHRADNHRVARRADHARDHNYMANGDDYHPAKHYDDDTTSDNDDCPGGHYHDDCPFYNNVNLRSTHDRDNCPTCSGTAARNDRGDGK